MVITVGSRASGLAYRMFSNELKAFRKIAMHANIQYLCEEQDKERQSKAEEEFDEVLDFAEEIMFAAED